MNRILTVLSLVLACLVGPQLAFAQSYEDLVQQTRTAMSDYLAGKTPVPPVVDPKVLPPLQQATVKPPEHHFTGRVGSAAREATAQGEAVNPLMSGLRLEEDYKGIRREMGTMVVSYAFDDAAAMGAQGEHLEAGSRPLTDTERKAVKEVLHQQLPKQVALRFEEASHPTDAYLHITAAELQQRESSETGSPGKMLGYASYPNPAGGKLVIDRNLCAPRKPDCIRLKGVVRHEIGHTLGLRHPSDAGAKYSRYPSLMQAVNFRYNDYQPHDIASMQQLYGVASGSTQSAPPAAAVATAAGTSGSAPAPMPAAKAQTSFASFGELLRRMMMGKQE